MKSPAKPAEKPARKKTTRYEKPRIRRLGRVGLKPVPTQARRFQDEDSGGLPGG